MDFDSPAAAQKAVASLKASGVQAQMAKVSFISPSSLWTDELLAVDMLLWDLEVLINLGTVKVYGCKKAT